MISSGESLGWDIVIDVFKCPRGVPQGTLRKVSICPAGPAQNDAGKIYLQVDTPSAALCRFRQANHLSQTQHGPKRERKENEMIAK